MKKISIHLLSYALLSPSLIALQSNSSYWSYDKDVCHLDQVLTIYHVNARDPRGDTLLHVAAYFSDKDAAQTLIKDHKAAINVRNKQRESPLHYVFEGLTELHDYERKDQTKELLDLLLKAGINKSLQDKNGHTALTKAEEAAKDNDIARILLIPSINQLKKASRPKQQKSPIKSKNNHTANPKKSRVLQGWFLPFIALFLLIWVYTIYTLLGESSKASKTSTPSSNG